MCVSSFSFSTLVLGHVWFCHTRSDPSNNFRHQTILPDPRNPSLVKLSWLYTFLAIPPETIASSLANPLEWKELANREPAGNIESLLQFVSS